MGRLIDNCFWKNIIGHILGIDTPNLSGKWEGEVYFKSKNGEKKPNKKTIK